MANTTETQTDRRSERTRTQDAWDVDKLRVALRPRYESATRVVDPFSVVQQDRDLTLAEAVFS